MIDNVNLRVTWIAATGAGGWDAMDGVTVPPEATSAEGLAAATGIKVATLVESNGFAAV